VGRGEQATELLLDLLADPARATSHGQNAVGRLADLLRDERNLRLAENRLPDLTGSPDPAVRRWAFLLAYRVAQVRGEKDRANRLLDEMMAMPGDGGNVGGFPSVIVRLLTDAERYDDAVDYARNGAQGLSRRNRTQLLRNAASRLAGSERSRQRGIELYREVTERGSSNVHNDRRRLIQKLTEAGRMDEAWEELRQFRRASSDWSFWQAFRTLLRSEPQAETAVSRGIAAWRRGRGWHGSHGDGVWHELIRRAGAAIKSRQLSQSTRNDLAKALLRRLSNVLSGSSSSPYAGRELDVARKLNVQEEAEQLIEEAASSDDPQRMLRAADYMRRMGGRGGSGPPMSGAGFWLWRPPRPSRSAPPAVPFTATPPRRTGGHRPWRCSGCGGKPANSTNRATSGGALTACIGSARGKRPAPSPRIFWTIPVCGPRIPAISAVSPRTATRRRIT
jgi:hypothetical protein